MDRLSMQFVTGGQKTEKWEVDRFLKNGGRLFFVLADREEASRWLDNAQCVMEHIAYQHHLWVRVLCGTLQDVANLRQKFAHATYMRSTPLEEIQWDDFLEAFHQEYFTSTVQVAKK